MQLSYFPRPAIPISNGNKNPELSEYRVICCSVRQSNLQNFPVSS